MRRILVTGASTWTGGRLVWELEQRRGFEVFAVDEIPPRIAFTSPFAQLEIDRIELARHILDVAPDTVVHLLTVDRSGDLGPTRAHEQAVVGIQAVFGAVGRCDAVRRVVVKSDAAIYPIGPRSPSIFSEAIDHRGNLSRYGREIADLEELVTRVAPHQERVSYAVLRLAPIFGRNIRNPISRYLSLPVVPTLMGFDPRLHLIHEEDAVAAFLAAIDSDVAGTFNIAAAGAFYLSRLIRLGRRLGQPLPGRTFERALRGLSRVDITVASHLRAMLKHGLVLDTTSMRHDLGFSPQLTTRQTALAGYGRLAPSTP
jgi:UDP-glucose 4-epimerase